MLDGGIEEGVWSRIAAAPAKRVRLELELRLGPLAGSWPSSKFLRVAPEAEFGGRSRDWKMGIPEQTQKAGKSYFAENGALDMRFREVAAKDLASWNMTGATGKD